MSGERRRLLIAVGIALAFLLALCVLWWITSSEEPGMEIPRPEFSDETQASDTEVQPLPDARLADEAESAPEDAAPEKEAVAPRPAARAIPQPSGAPAPMIQGIVLDENRLPVAGAEVGAFKAEESEYRPWRTSKTDAQGVFTFQSLVSGTYRLRASHPDYIVSALSDPVKVKEGAFLPEVTLILRKAYLITGFVRDDQGIPIDGAELSCFAADWIGSWGRSSTPRTVSGSDGAYRLGIVRWEKSYVSVEKEGYADEARFVSRDPLNEETRHDFALRKAFAISGKVVNAEGSALTGVLLSCVPKTGDKSYTATTDREGLFKFDVPEGLYELGVDDQCLPMSFSGQGGITTGVMGTRDQDDWILLKDDVPGGTSGLVLVLDAASLGLFTVAGTVLDMETRIPLEKCYVNYTYIYAASEGGSPIKSGGSIYTGQDGRFKIVLRPHSGQGEVKLSAQHEGYVAAFLDPIPVPAKGGEREVVLSLGKQGISLEVAVQDEAGRPVQGATISLTARGDVVETDDEGVARFELMNPKGGEFLLIRCGGPSPVYHRITPAEAAAARVVVQVSHPEGGS